MEADKPKKVIGPGAELLPLAEAAEISGYTPEYLNLLSRQGKMKAQKIGRNWYTTKDWMLEYFYPENYQAKAAEEASRKAAEEKRKAELAQAAQQEKEKLIQAELENKLQVETQKIHAHWEAKNQQLRVSERESEVSPRFTPLKLALAVVMILVAIGVAQTIRFLNARNFFNPPAAPTDVMVADNGKINNDGWVLAAETNASNEMFASENFGIREIKFGGDVALLAASDQDVPIKITDIRSEVITTKNQDEFKLLVYWKTNKLAESSIEYSNMGGSNSHVVKENDYGYSHSIILSGLQPATAYVYQINARDKWGNTIDSDRYSAYTGSKQASVIDLIMGAVKDTFSWAMKK